MGYVSWIGKYETSNSVLVDLLEKAGAVFYVKTSVPQSLMVCETVNNVIGRTVNPRGSPLICCSRYASQLPSWHLAKLLSNFLN
jgi:amidase